MAPEEEKKKMTPEEKRNLVVSLLTLSKNGIDLKELDRKKKRAFLLLLQFAYSLNGLVIDGLQDNFKKNSAKDSRKRDKKPLIC